MIIIKGNVPSLRHPMVSTIADFFTTSKKYCYQSTDAKIYTQPYCLVDMVYFNLYVELLGGKDKVAR